MYSCSGHFGTINGFRLGRLPSIPVDWAELNTAWGQTVLLLHSLTRRIQLQLQRYQLVPYGNFSYVKVLADDKDLPLYGSGGFRLIWDTKFDAGQVLYLELLPLQCSSRPGRQSCEFLLSFTMSIESLLRIYIAIDATPLGAYIRFVITLSLQGWRLS